VTYAPATLQALRSYLVGKGAPVLGIVGTATTHTKGYHLGKDRIYKIPPGLGSADYSVRLARDAGGLTDAAAAIDIGRHDGLIELGRHLLEEARAGRLNDVRELIAERSDGSHLWRFDNAYKILTGTPGSNELYHHLHVSYHRDSQRRTKLPPYQRFYELPDTGTEEPVYSVIGQRSAVASAGTPYYATADATTPSGTLSSERRFDLVAQDKPGKLGEPGGPTAFLVDGAGDGAPAPMSWIRAGALRSFRDESYNAGVAAAAKAASEAKR
jgi:hypothetical protein